MAANIFTGAINNNWGTAGNWSLGTVPTATDGHVATFNATSPNCTVDVSDKVCNNIDFTGYTNTINMLFRITVSGNVTLGSTMLIIGTGALRVNSTGTLTSNGKPWNRPLIFSTTGAAMTFTIVGDWYVTNLTCGDTGAASHTLNSTAGAKIYVSGNLNKGGVAPSMSGTTEIVLNGNGTWSNPTGNGSAIFGNPVTINSPGGNITIDGGSTYIQFRSTLKHINGTVTCTGTFAAIIATLDTNDQIPFSTLQIGSTVTLLSNATTNTLTFPNSTISTINGFRINTNNLSVTSTGGSTGTTKFVMVGTGSWTHTGAGYIGNDLEFNTTGTVSVTGNVYWGDTGRTLGYVPNTGAVNTGTSTLRLRSNANQNINTNTLLWENIVFINGTTTLQSDLRATGNVSQSGGNLVLNSVGGSKLYVGGNFTLGITTNTFTGSAEVVMNGTGTLSASGSMTTGYMSNNLTIDTLSGTISMSGLFPYQGGTFRHLNGSFNGGTGTLHIAYPGPATTTTLNLGSITLGNLRTDGSTTANITLQSNLNLSGNFLHNAGATNINGFEVRVGGNLTINALGSTGGTAKIVMVGNGTWSHTNTGSVGNDLEFNTTGTISVTGAVYYSTKTLSHISGTVITTGSTLNIAGNATFDTKGSPIAGATTTSSTGINWNNISINAVRPLTLTSDLRVVNNLTVIDSLDSINKTTTEKVYIGGTLNSTYTIATIAFNGTAEIVMDGTGNISSTGGQIFDISQPLNITTSGAITTANYVRVKNTFTINSGTVIFGSGSTLDLSTGSSFIVNAGSFTTTGHTLAISGNTTLNTSLVTWNTITTIASLTITLLSNLNTTNLTIGTGATQTLSFILGGNTLSVSNTLTILANATFNLPSNLQVTNLILGNGVNAPITINGLFNLSVSGNLTENHGASSTVTGSSTIVLNGTGIWSNASTGPLYMNLTIDTLGTITLGSSLTFGGLKTLKRLQGVVNTAGNTLNLTNCTVDTNGIPWNNISVTNISTITINSLLTATGTMTLPAAAVTFAGSAGFNCGTLAAQSTLSANVTITLQSLITYNINNNFNVTGNSSFKYLFKSSTAGTRAILTLGATANQNVLFADATDIDSSLGQTVYSFNGVLSNTLNWTLLSPDSISSGIFTFAS